MRNETIILASSSPRRIEMMRKNGFNPIIIPANVAEIIPEDLKATEAVMYLALKKALAVEAELSNTDHKNPFIIAADTVVCNHRIIGKPSNREDALNILMELCGTCHFVITGVCMLKAGSTKRRCFFETTKVFFKNYTAAELDSYLDTDEAYDKAGAYAIQGYFGKYVDHIEGDINNVIGFPWDRIQVEFERL